MARDVVYIRTKAILSQSPFTDQACRLDINTTAQFDGKQKTKQNICQSGCYLELIKEVNTTPLPPQKKKKKGKKRKNKKQQLQTRFKTREELAVQFQTMSIFLARLLHAADSLMFGTKRANSLCPRRTKLSEVSFKPAVTLRGALHVHFL